MRGIFLAALLGAATCFPTFAQELLREDGDAREVYFLIDASGSMSNRMNLAEKLIETRIAELSKEVGPLLVSRTYFRADIESSPNACEAPISINAPVPVANSKPEVHSRFWNDSSPLGSALEAALLHIGDRPADVFLVSDEMQTPNCGPDVCEVAGRYLPKSGVRVGRIGVNSAPADHDRLGCISAASNSTSPRVSGLGASLSASMEKNTGRDANEVNWDDEGIGERWLWLVAILLVAAACFAFGMRTGGQAKILEGRISNIQDRQRLQLTDPSNASSYAEEIAKNSSPKLPPYSKMEWAARILAGFGVVLLGLLLFTEGNILGLVDANAARKLSWMILSSNFATALSVFLASPIVFLFSQQWRLIQARSTFGLVSGLAAQEEAKRQQDQIDNIYEKLKSVRASITATRVDTSWAASRRISFKTQRRLLDYDDLDREALNRAVQILLQLAQGELPDRSHATKESLSKAIEQYEHYAPRGIILKKLSFSDLIKSLLEHGRIVEMQQEWKALAESVEKGDVQSVKRWLKVVCA